MSENMLSVRVFTGQIIQYITIAPERLQIRDDDDKELSECAICMHNVRDIILQPCGHCYMCEHCYYKIIDGLCPICRTPLTGYSMVYSYSVKKEPIHQHMQFESYNIFSL